MEGRKVRMKGIAPLMVSPPRTIFLFAPTVDVFRISPISPQRSISLASTPSPHEQISNQYFYSYQQLFVAQCGPKSSLEPGILPPCHQSPSIWTNDNGFFFATFLILLLNPNSVT